MCVSVCECKLLPCLSSQPQLRARLKHRLKANQVTADGVRTGAVHSLVCVSVCVCVCVRKRERSTQPSKHLYVNVYAGVAAKNRTCYLTVFPWCHSTVAEVSNARRHHSSLCVRVQFILMLFSWKGHVYVLALPMRPTSFSSVFRGSQAPQSFCW